MVGPSLPQCILQLLISFFLFVVIKGWIVPNLLGKKKFCFLPILHIQQA